ncbi:MAG: hypothetical protein R6X33_03920 [Candidatus Brocadiia bacterium]
MWGDKALNITVARAGFWDHRGANTAVDRCTFQQLRGWLEEGDTEAVESAFRLPEAEPGTPSRPCQVGGARLVLRFPRGVVPQSATLDIDEGRISVDLAGDGGEAGRLGITQAPDRELTSLHLPPDLADEIGFELIPAWEWIGEDLSDRGVRLPEVRAPGEPEGIHSVVQSLPEDAGLAVAVRRRGPHLLLATAKGDPPDDDPLPQATALLERDAGEVKSAAGRTWGEMAETAPRLELPDATLMRMYEYGLARLAGCTMADSPGAVPAGLQGPFMEDTALPPWSNDYHFNVNVQLMYRPLLPTNLHGHFAPLWEMLRGWIPRMQRRGEDFFGTPGALMLPHATDDRCRPIGTYWTGTIDHGCCAWIARLAWLYYLYSGDEDTLREVAWPLLAGAFEGYYAMAERVPDGAGGTRLSLPVTVSPEYGGSGPDAWGRDASFQLAAWHSVVEALRGAAEVLGRPVDARWDEVAEDLPPYTLLEGAPDEAASGLSLQQFTGRDSDRRIAVWEGQDLAESHRHHSHMACFYPFETVDPLDPDHAEVAANTYDTWTYRGAGMWSGWCLTWASILCSRYNRPTAAVAWLRWLGTAFSNEGGNTNHDGAPGSTILTGRSAERARRRGGREIIQLDAALGAVTAVLELLVQPRRDAVHVLPALPVGWRSLEFDGIGCPGGFRLGATVRRGRPQEIRVRSTRDGTLRLAHHMGDKVRVDGVMRKGDVLEIAAEPGQSLTVRPADAEGRVD